MKKDPKIRFWAKVDKTASCYLWISHIDDLGYAKFWLDGSRLAHEVIWEWELGPIPSGLEICHSCDVRRCVRLEHLSLGTHSDNMRDMALKNRAPSNLSQSQMLEVLKLSGQLSRKELATKFSVSYWCIRDIQRGRSGKHLPGRNI